MLCTCAQCAQQYKQTRMRFVIFVSLLLLTFAEFIVALVTLRSLCLHISFLSVRMVYAVVHRERTPYNDHRVEFKIAFCEFTENIECHLN